MNRSKESTRQELYDLVWATPIAKLSKEFGLCRRPTHCQRHTARQLPPSSPAISLTNGESTH
jgi:hypothetical protein